MKDTLPDICYSILKSEGVLIILHKGMKGFYYSKDMRECDIETVDRMNASIGVTVAQRRAMEIGSMFGWDTLGVDPSLYS